MYFSRGKIEEIGHNYEKWDRLAMKILTRILGDCELLKALKNFLNFQVS